MNTFEFIGKMKLGKQTEKFNPIESTKSAKGWLGTRIKFNLVNETGYHMIECFEGYMSNGSTICYVLGKDKDPVTNKFPKMQVKWDDRLKPEIVDSVASFSKYKIEIDGEKFEYLAGADFAIKLVQILQDKAHEDKRFLIEGDIVYNEYNGNTYKKFVPKSVTHITDDTLPNRTLAKYDFYYGQDCLDDTMFEETGKYIVKGYTRQWDSTVKKEVAYPETFIIDTSKAENDKQKKMFDIIKSRFVVDGDEFYKTSLKCIQINGTERKEITIDDLDDDEVEMIEVGLATLEDFQKEYGSTNGASIREAKIVGFGKGSLKGSAKTDFTIDDFMSQDVTDELMMDDEEEEELPF